MSTVALKGRMEAKENIDSEDDLLVPGFVDSQVDGAFGVEGCRGGG